MGASCSSSNTTNDSLNISTSSFHSLPNESSTTLAPTPIKVEIVRNLEEALSPVSSSPENKKASGATPKFVQTPLNRKKPTASPPITNTLIYTPPLLCTPKDDDHYRVLPGTMNKSRRPASVDVTGLMSNQLSSAAAANNRKSRRKSSQLLPPKMIRDRKNTYKQFNFSEIEDKIGVDDDLDNDLFNLELPNNCIIYFRNNINMRELILKVLDEKKYLSQILYNEKEVIDKLLNSNSIVNINNNKNGNNNGYNNNNDISLFIMDYVNENDFELIKKIRKEIKEDEMSIILCSANEDDIKYKECVNIGVNEIFINKNISFNDVSLRIENLNKMKKLLINKYESDKYRKLLTTMVPRHIAYQLIEGNMNIAEEYDEVTILFTDIVNFTEMTAQVDTIKTINLLNSLFTEFDEIVGKHGVYKIGDAYMAVSGHDGIKNHAERMLDTARDLLKISRCIVKPTGEILKIRIGIHSGTAYGGVIGQKVPRFCLFGDTVNTASRMESNGIPDLIHISEATYKELPKEKQKYFAERGDIYVKGKGIMKSYICDTSDELPDNDFCKMAREAFYLEAKERTSFKLLGGGIKNKKEKIISRTLSK